MFQGKLGDCVPLYQKAITIWEKTGDPLLATGYNNLAGVYKAQASSCDHPPSHPAVLWEY